MTSPPPKKQLLGLAFKALNSYEAKTPRCGNCKHHTTAKVILRNSLPEVVIPPLCNLGQFAETGYGLCNEWQSRKGERLDKHD